MIVWFRGSCQTHIRRLCFSCFSHHDLSLQLHLLLAHPLWLLTMAPSTQDSSHSSDYFDDDPELLKAIYEVEFPEDTAVSSAKSLSPPPLAQPPQLGVYERQGRDAEERERGSHADDLLGLDADQPPPLTQRSLKRQRSPDDDLYADEDGMQYHSVLNAVDWKDAEDEDSYLDSHTYGAARFGEFGEYMTRKRAKLQVQNVELVGGEDETGQSSKIFSGLQIYVCLLRVFCHRLRLTSATDQWLD